MIVSIKHKGLKLLWEKDDGSKLPQPYVKKILNALHRLNVMIHVQELKDFQSYRLHQLSGNLIDYWSITISGNDRIIFKFIDGDVYLLNYLDYH